MMLGKARLHLVALIAAAAFLLLWPGDLSAQKGGGPNFWPQVYVELDGYWVDGEEHININSNLDANGVMFDVWVQFTPPEWFVASDIQVDDGAYVGQTWENFNVGMNNSPCHHGSGFGYQWQDATTNLATVFTDSGSIPEGTWNGFQDVGGLEKAVVEYPGFLTTLYPGLSPHARYYSHNMWGDTHLVAQLLIFEPDTDLTGLGLPNFDGLGYPSLMVTQDPTAPPSPGQVTDICTDWESNDRYFNWVDDDSFSGVVVRQNPPDWDNYNFATWVRGRPDADGDGVENDMDTCPFDENWDENPRHGNGPDGDGLDSACDLEPEDHNPDQDDDGYLNRGDNCPTEPNGCSDSGCGPIWNGGWDNQADNDGDGIGNVCDTEGNGPDDVDGFQPERWSDFWVEVSGDSDEDFWSDALENIAGSWPHSSESTPEGLWRTPQTCSDTLDNDLDGLVDGYDLGCDADDDHVANMFDACPEEAEDFDGFEDADGCPEADNDIDGICDPWYGESSCWGSDDCPNVPEDYDAFQDWDGCPEPDNDDDGFPDVTDDCPGTDWTAGPDGEADSGDEPHDVWGIPIQTKEDYDGIIDWDGCHDSPGDDYDGDGFDDQAETYIGTDPTDACTDAPGHDAWPLDINMDKYVSAVGDVLNFRGHIGADPDDPEWVQRLDLNMDSYLSAVGDALMYRGMIGQGCT